MDKMKIGLVGCGVISDIYLQNSRLYDVMEIVSCFDMDEERAQEKADQYGIKQAKDLQEIMESKEIDVVLNLTTPFAHFPVIMQALEHGKHVYTEKPLSITCEEGRRVLELARQKTLRVGCAPDTFLGGRLQTIRKLIDDGWIGKPIAATAFMLCHGHEMWHPGPEFLYQKGAGPLFDMGPYYVTALLSLLGPVCRVCGSTQTSIRERTITSEPLKGKKFLVEVPTHVSCNLEFVQNATASLITSFEVWDFHLPKMEIYGADGTISIVDADPFAGPNIFGGEILLRRPDAADWNGFPTTIPRHDATEWERVPTVFPYNENSRSVGLADMCHSIRTGKPHKASIEMAYHSLELMHGVYSSAETGKYYTMESTFDQPEPMDMNVPEYEFK